MNLLGKMLPMLTAESLCDACGEELGDTEGLGALLFTLHGTDAVCVTCIAAVFHWAARVAEGTVTPSQN